MMNGRTPTDDVEGVVEGVNATGLKIGGAWVNVSKFKPVELPDVGAHVRLQVDSKGFIVKLEDLTTPAVSSDKLAVTAKDERITRLAVLKAAAEFGASRPDLKSSEVLMIADKWMAWVTQE
ncbi:MAG TPA: hypothetical protein VFB50_03515 [Chloroflexota bacterium]|nr:hypothetical protein [Chloroflexota bacterium]